MIHVREAGYIYPSGSQIGPINIDVYAGECVLLTGPTGCGKSTILRLIAGLLARQGRGQIQGEIRVAGQDPALLSAKERLLSIGFVGQDPDDAIIAGRVEDEVAFALEGLGWPGPKIQQRVQELLEQVGLSGFQNRDPRQLSGGQRQRLAIAAALAGGGQALLLDEPLAWLDPESAQSVLETLKRVAEHGVAVLLVEHRLEYAGPWASRVLKMGAVEPLAPVEAVEPMPIVQQNPVLQLKNVSAGYPGKTVLKHLEMQIYPWERVALVGQNGTGKSTLLHVISGQHTPSAGKVIRHGRMGLVPQNPDLALLCATVREELALGVEEYGGAPSRITDVAEAFSLTPLLDRPPQALSRGQRLRVAVGAMLCAQPALLLLDEPTAGQDHEQVERMFVGLKKENIPILFSCHAPDVVQRHATRRVLLQEGPVAENTLPPTQTFVAQGFDPRTRLALLLGLGWAGLCLEGTWPLLMLACLPTILLLIHPKAAGWRMRLAGGAAVLVWSTVISQGLFWAGWPRTPLWALGPIHLYKEGLLHGLVASCRFVASLAGGALLVITTPTDRLVAALRRSGLPSGLLLMTTTALRFVPLVAEEWATVRQARAARGRPVWQRPLWSWLVLEAAFFRPVIARSLRRSQALAESLDSRGFDPLQERTYLHPLQFRWRDYGVLGMLGLGLLGLGTARLLFILYAQDLWYSPSLRPFYAWIRMYL